MNESGSSEVAMHFPQNIRPPGASKSLEYSSGAHKGREISQAPDASGLGLWICEPATDHLWPTDWFLRVTELQPAQIGSQLSAFISCLHPEDGRALAAALEQSTREHSKLEMEVRIVRRDDTVRWFSLKGHALVGENGSLRIIGIVTDATAQKLQQEEVQRLQADIGSLVENFPDIVVRLDASGKILLASAATLNRIWGESAASFSLLQHLRDVSAKALSTNTRQLQEGCVEVAGRFHWIETRAIPEPHPDGSTSVLSFTRDISERKLNQDLLESSRRSLLHALESMELAHDAANMGYWEWDLVADKVYWSDRVYTIFGVSPASTPSYQAWIDCVHPDDRKTCVTALEKIYGPTAKYHCQYRIVHPDGSIRWMEGFGKLILDFTGQPVRMIGTVIDITEQKEQEAALVHFEKLSSAMRLSATLAHEINNPLTAVTYLLHLALQDKGLARETRTRLTEAQEELARAAHVASQTLSLYRPPTEKTVVDVSSMVRELLQIYRHRLQSRKVETIVQLEDSARISAPVGELRQIVSNLLVNAMDAAAAGKRRVFIRVRTIHSPCSEAPAKVQIAVADEGPGIERSLRQKVFEPFFTTKTSDGVGLGLSLARELITRNSGKIAVRSCTVRGSSWTTFVISFPAAQTANRAEAHDAAAGRAA